MITAGQKQRLSIVVELPLKEVDLSLAMPEFFIWFLILTLKINV